MPNMLTVGVVQLYVCVEKEFFGKIGEKEKK